MARYIYVDNSNLFIEARRLAAVQAGLVGSMRQAQAVRALDNTYNLDYALLRDFLAEGHEVGRSVLFGSMAATGTGAVWEHAEAAGWEVFSFEPAFPI